MNKQSKLSTNQVAFLTRALKEGGGNIELGELAKVLGKQKGNVLRKFESSFPEEHLFKMKNCNKNVKTYMLDPVTAGALAMSYDPMLGMEVLIILQGAIAEMKKAHGLLLSGQEELAIETLSSFLANLDKKLMHSDSDSENETRCKALGQLRRKSFFRDKKA